VVKSDPKTQDDWTIHAEHSRSQESTLDIRAEKDFADNRITLLIECKKNNPEFINWVFFSKYPYPVHNPFVVSRLKNMPSEAPRPGWSVDCSLIQRAITFSITSEARETRGDYSGHKNNSSKTKTSNASITEAAHQIALATQAIMDEDFVFGTTLGSIEVPPQMPWRTQFLIPLIVTTARLYICEFKPSDVDPQTGQIEHSKAQLVECSELVYEYPLPRHLQARVGNVDAALKNGSIEKFMRMHIIIVHSGHFKEFLRSFYLEGEKPTELAAKDTSKGHGSS
jgi:hypothetical protein